MDEFLSYLVIGVLSGFVYSLIALGFVLIFRASGVLNFAQGHMMIIGAYIFYALASRVGLPTWLAVLGILIIMALLGLLIAHLIIKPLIGQPVMSVILATLAMAQILSGVMILIWGSEILTLPSLFPEGSITFLRVSISYEYLSFMIVVLVLFAVLAIFFKFTSIGLSIMAVADDTQAAQAMGIRVTKVIAMTWIIASIVGGVGGILLTSITGIHYSAVNIGLGALAVALVGGLQSLGGVILAGPLIGIIGAVTAGYIDPHISVTTREVMPYIVLVIVLMIRPTGFFGWKRIERV